jgi:hypothetical protein
MTTKLQKPADHFEVEYHLTPLGWRRGSEWFFGKMQAETEPPQDRVLTLKKQLFQRSVESQKEVSWITVWRDPKLAEREIDELKIRFSMPEGA